MWKPGGGTYQDIPLDVTSTCDIVHCVNNTKQHRCNAAALHVCYMALLSKRVMFIYDNASAPKAHQSRVFSVTNKVRIVRMVGNDVRTTMKAVCISAIAVNL